MHVGIAGEVRCVVTKADGTVKEDTGFQKNIILNQGLEFFAGGKGRYMNEYCAIGSGNSTPAITQVGLDSFVAVTGVISVADTYNYAYVDNGDKLYKMSMIRPFRFTGLNNVNISECGLVSMYQGTDPANTLHLCTRALLKDSAGKPTTITVLTGETLDIYYKLWRVISTVDTNHVINVLDGSGGSVPYNVIVRPAMIGDSMWIAVGANAKGVRQDTYFYIETAGDLGSITSQPNGWGHSYTSLDWNAYTPNSYKRKATASFNLNQANTNIRCVSTCRDEAFNFFPFQMRFGSVANDSPIVKTNTQTLTIPFEVSWGRYEGAL